MLRTRDIVAVLLSVVLCRMAWTSDQDTSNSLRASLRLAFYTSAQLSAPLDVDGDGDSEALVVASTSDEKWNLSVLDLTPMHHASFQSGGVPFLPQVLAVSSDFGLDGKEDKEKKPLILKTGQLLLHHHKRLPHKRKFVESDDRTRHFFCGTDWHHAATTCHTPCPSGDASACPDGETCYADTPCDSHDSSNKQANEEEEMDLSQLYSTTTLAGGLPSVVTYWSDGTLTLHTLTTSEHNDKELVLKFKWRHTLAHGPLEQAHVTFVEAEDVPIAEDSNMGRHGMVLVGGTRTLPETDEEEGPRVSVLYALDAFSGSHMWKVDKDEEEETKKQDNMTDVPLFPLPRGSSSTARRRSHVVPSRAGESQDTAAALPNCFKAFRHSLFKNSALPHFYGSSQDATSQLLHLDRHVHAPQHHRVAKKVAQQREAQKKGRKTPHSSSSSTHRRRTKQKHPKLVFGRPNVVLTHTSEGLDILSLKNGRALCHLSLLEKVLYADLNQDMHLDHVQVITDHIQDVTQHENKWITELASQVQLENDQDTRKRPHRLSRNHRLCHVLGLSGMPPREQLFAANVCGPSSGSSLGVMANALEPAPPLVVDGTDVVVALNHGVISRYHAPTGRNQWQRTLNVRDTTTPTWSSESLDTASLRALPMARAAASPLLWTGENSMMLLSPGRGHAMASATFPQPSIGRPLLADVSGDGTADVIVQSANAIWGYQVVVHTGTSIVFRVLVGLLMCGMALALLRNRFASRSGADKRSTDA